MFKLNEIVNTNSEMLKTSIDSLSCFLDKISTHCEEDVKKELIKQAGIFNNKHFTLDVANYVIEEMKPAIGSKSIKELLEEQHITPESAKSEIRKAYEEARNYALREGLNAPVIPTEYNEYDYYVVLSMCIADFWYSGIEDPECFNMIAYQWLSDPDAKPTKVWDYFFG